MLLVPLCRPAARRALSFATPLLGSAVARVGTGDRVGTMMTHYSLFICKWGQENRKHTTHYHYLWTLTLSLSPMHVYISPLTTAQCTISHTRTSPYVIHTGCVAYDDLNMHIHMHSDNVVNPRQTRRYQYRPTTQLSTTYTRPVHRKSPPPRMMLRLLCCESAIWLPNKSVRWLWQDLHPFSARLSCRC